VSGRGTPVTLIGDPVAHSVSPPMQQAAFDALGLPIAYTSLRVGRGDLRAAFSALRVSALGLNVTAPLKEAIIPLLDEIDPSAKDAGSVNTVRFGEGGAWGGSTDGGGFLDALDAAGVERVTDSVVLGSGGAARAVAAALLSRGSAVVVAARNARSGERLVADLSGLGMGSGGPSIRAVNFHRPELAEALPHAGLLVNATPVGSWSELGSSPVPGAVLHANLTVFDLVSRPRRTRLLLEAGDRGCRVIEGVEMLLRQGARSFQVWTGRPAPLEVMREAALHALDQEPEPASASTAGWPS
jgi:shikimate dehydrogenase